MLAAHDRALVARVSWLFSAYGQNFLQMMLRLGQTQPGAQGGGRPEGPADRLGDVAAFILSQAGRLARAPRGAADWGLLHLVNGGEASRYDMAQTIFALAWPDRAPPKMEPVPTSAFPTPAKRALNGVLDTTRLAAGLRPATAPLGRGDGRRDRAACAHRGDGMRKGIILAGRARARGCTPLTLAVSKQLLPVYDKPMIYYPLSVPAAGRRARDPDHHHAGGPGGLQALLGDGSQLGIHLEYVVQLKPDGLAQAYILGEEFVGGGP